MQITIDKKTGVLLAIIALLGATVVGFAINGKGHGVLLYLSSYLLAQ
jgi:hypothetical protein